MSHRKLEPGKLVVASHNKGKIREINELLQPYGFEVISAGELDLPEPDETGVTFEENAAIKAHAAAKASRLPALADDSGFCVAALNGERRTTSAGDPLLPCCAWPGRTAAKNSSAARSRDRSSGRRAVRRASATTRFSSRMAMSGPSVK